MSLNSPPVITAKKEEKAILIGVELKGRQQYSEQEYLDELEQLVLTAGAVTVKRFTQKLDRPDPKYYIGSGKMKELIETVNALGADMVIFDDELSPSQIRNIEAELKDVKILDRSNLILDIFAKNARTAQAKAQVELAQSEYLLPRLTRMWTHLSKQRGGVGMRGPGEKEIETDRRALRYRITLLKNRLKEIESQGITQRSNRSGQIRVALVGYTNVGKSTLMNLLSKANVLAENKLFATLDSTVRKVVLEDPATNLPVVMLLSDTVGFIRKLPTQLIESFKSTLSEVVEADLLIHVVDISNPRFEDQMQVVKDTLRNIGAGSKPVLLVFNKIDLFRGEEDDFFIGHQGMSAAEFEKSWVARENTPAVFISASEKQNIAKLRDTVIDVLKQNGLIPS